MRRLAACVAALALALAPTRALALDGNDSLVLRLAGGGEVEGWFYSVADGVLTVSGDNRFTRIPVSAVVAVQRDGEPLPMAVFQSEVDQAQALLDAMRADPPPHPPAGVVIGASVLWAGAAPASVGNWKKAAAYSVVEGVLVGTAIANARAGSAAVLVPLLGLDVLFKGYAAGEAVRVTKKRRARLRPAGEPTASGGAAAR